MCFNGGWHSLSSMSQSLGLFSADMVMYVIVEHTKCTPFSLVKGRLVHCPMKTKKFCVNSLDDNKKCRLTIKNVEISWCFCIKLKSSLWLFAIIVYLVKCSVIHWHFNNNISEFIHFIRLYSRTTCCSSSGCKTTHHNVA